jgi:predicted Zn-dependent peptidase
MIDNYFMMDIMNLDDIETRRKKMKAVTADEIVKVAKKIKMDTIYCIEGINK